MSRRSGKIEPGEIHIKKSRFSESKIINVLRGAEAGVSLEELIRQPGFSKGHFYKGKGKNSGMSVSESKREKELEEENQRLKQMYTNLSLEHEALKDIIEQTLTVEERRELRQGGPPARHNS